jgi:hypothetical protein
MLPLGTRDPAIAALSTTSKSLSESSSNRIQFASHLRRFASTLGHLCLSQNPGCADTLTELESLLGTISDSEVRYAASQSRAAEDLRDICERYQVLFRQNEAYLAARLRFNKAAEALNQVEALEAEQNEKSARPSVKSQIGIMVGQAEDLHDETLVDIKDELALLIEVRGKYNAFKTRRLRSAWRIYARGLGEFQRDQVGAYRRIQELLGQLRLTGLADVQADVERALVQRDVVEADPDEIPIPVADEVR